MRRKYSPQWILLVVSLFAISSTFMFQPAAMANSVTVDCSGQTPGAFTSIQSAINSLDVTGPHSVFIVPGRPCADNISIIDRQRLTIFTTNGTAPITSAGGLGRDVISIQGSTGIVLTNLDLSGGTRGVAILRGSQVTITGTSISGNRVGIQLNSNSNLTLTANLHDNLGIGISMNDSLISATNTQVTNSGAAGIFLTRSRGLFQRLTVANSANSGMVFANGSSGQLIGSVIQNNANLGVSVEDGSSVRMLGIGGATPQPTVIEGSSSIGINIFSAHLALLNGVIVRNNGFGGGPLNAGIRADDNATMLTSGTGDVQITGNTGPGVDATLGGNLDLTGTDISNNTGDGIRGAGHVHIGFFPPNTNTFNNNGGRSIACDESSVVVGDTGDIKGIHCEVRSFLVPGGNAHHGMRDKGPDDLDD